MSDLFPKIPKTKQYVHANADCNGWPVCMCGNSQIDDEDWSVTTKYLKADEVPEILLDAKTTAQYIEKLVNKDLNDKNGTWTQL